MIDLEGRSSPMDLEMSSSVSSPEMKQQEEAEKEERLRARQKKLQKQEVSGKERQSWYFRLFFVNI